MTVEALLAWARAWSVWDTTDGDARAREAVTLLQHVLGWSTARLLAHTDHPVSAAQHTSFAELIARRAHGEPIAYLTGEREFWSLPLQVDTRVLIPRHETEQLVEQVLALMPRATTSRILELGTGSGAIAFALATELPQAEIIATDISTAALAVAQANQQRLAIGNITWHCGDWYRFLPHNNFDLVCANPPYVAAGDRHLHCGDVRFEPRLALVAGARGYGALATIIHGARAYLRRGGWLVLEHGYRQGAGVREKMHAAGLHTVTTHVDGAGLARVTVGR